MIQRSLLPEFDAPARTESPADQAQRDLIANELDVNLLVEAAAGTGKTTSLIGRMVNLIREGKCAIDKLAAVTFTRKAAAELRARFQAALEKAAREADGPARERLTDAVSHVERCFLGTIHAFCARLLRERPVEAGVDPTFHELDEPADNLLRRKAWDDYVSRLITADDPVLKELEELGLDIGDLQKAFGVLAEYPDVTEWPAAPVSPPDPAPVRAALENYVTHMAALAESFKDDIGNDKLMPKYRLIVRMVRQADLQKPAELAAILEEFKELKRNKVIQKSWLEGKEQALAELDRWNQFSLNWAIPFVERWRIVRYAPALRAVRPAVAIYDDLRRQAGGLSFADLLMKAAQLLRDKPAIRDYFRRRFTHLLVDEFQDTDPIQAEVMLLLAADDANETDWRKCRPAAGSLFVVGDPKQSIYRFRRADIVTYNQVREIITASGGRVVPLTANFRTTAPLIRWVNHTFEDRFPEAANAYSPARCPLQVGRPDAGDGDLAGVFRLNAPGQNKDEIHEHEAAIIARMIHQSIHGARTIARSRKELETGAGPVATPGDFLIVTLTTYNLSRYARKLEELGIPHQVTGGSALNELEELELLHRCLRCVARPDDPVALVAVLRSELFGLSDTALYAFRQAGGRFSFRSRVPGEGLRPDDVAAFQEAFDRLSRYGQWLRVLPATAAIEKVAADLGLPGRAAAALGGDVRAGSLAKAIELIRIKAAETPSVADLVDYLSELVEKEEMHDGMPVRPHEANAVRLMNLHKVKGLEAPVVFLADPTGERGDDVRSHIDRSGASVRGYLAIHESLPEGSWRTPRVLACPEGWSDFEAREQAFLNAETDRLLYVAATRAGNCLTIAQREERNDLNPWQFFEPHVHDMARVAGASRSMLELPGSVWPATPGTPEDVLAGDTREDALTNIMQRWQAVRRKTYDSEAIKTASLESVPPEVRRLFVRDGEHGVEWGTLIHALLEASARSRRAELRSLAESLCREHDINPELAGEAVHTVQAVQRSAIWQRSQESRQRLVEVPMQYMIAAGETESGLPTVRRGVIDLVFLESDGWVVVDYKTDSVAAGDLARLADHYRPQVEHYGRAWQQLVGQPVHELGLYFTRADFYFRL